MAVGLPGKLIAEFLGTFLLMVSILASGGNFLIVGLTLGLIVFLIGGISGAAVNPALAVGLLYTGTLDTLSLVLYSLVEVVGAVAAVYAYRAVA